MKKLWCMLLSIILLLNASACVKLPSEEVGETTPSTSATVEELPPSTGVSATDIELNMTEKALNVGESFQLEATVLPENATEGTLKWVTGNKNVATVENGKVTAVGAGTCSIMVKLEENPNIKASCRVEVTDPSAPVKPVPATGLKLEPADMVYRVMKAGESFTLTAEVTPDRATNKTVHWASSNEGTATVENGVITAVAEGETVISATADDNAIFTASVRIYVIAANASEVAVESVAVTPATAELVQGTTVALSATVAPANATVRGVIWKSADTAIATVNESGTVTGTGEGTVTISAISISDGTKVGECTVTVTHSDVKAEAIEISPNTAQVLQIGQILQMNAKILPENAANKGVTWVSSNSTVARVDAGGKVTAVGEGTAYIVGKATESVGSGAEIKQSISVKVVKELPVEDPNAVKVTEVVITPTEKVWLVLGETLQVDAKVLPDNATNQKIIWAVSSGCLSVDQNGLVTAVSVGSGVVVAKADDNLDIKASLEIVVVATEAEKPIPETAMVVTVYNEAGTQVIRSLRSEEVGHRFSLEMDQGSVYTISVSVPNGAADAEKQLSFTALNGADAYFTFDPATMKLTATAAGTGGILTVKGGDGTVYRYEIEITVVDPQPETALVIYAKSAEGSQILYTFKSDKYNAVITVPMQVGDVYILEGVVPANANEEERVISFSAYGNLAKQVTFDPEKLTVTAIAAGNDGGIVVKGGDGATYKYTLKFNVTAAAEPEPEPEPEITEFTVIVKKGEEIVKTLTGKLNAVFTVDMTVGDVYALEILVPTAAAEADKVVALSTYGNITKQVTLDKTALTVTAIAAGNDGGIVVKGGDGTTYKYTLKFNVTAAAEPEPEPEPEITEFTVIVKKGEEIVKTLTGNFNAVFTVDMTVGDVYALEILVPTAAAEADKVVALSTYGNITKQVTLDKTALTVTSIAAGNDGGIVVKGGDGTTYKYTLKFNVTAVA